MKLGLLKQSLAKLPPDMHDMEVIVRTAYNGEIQYDLLCYTGYAQSHGCILLGTMTDVQRMVESGEMEKPEGYFPPSESNE
jgi:hypothetical protein